MDRNNNNTDAVAVATVKSTDNHEVDLLSLSVEMTVYGIILALITPLTSKRLEASSVATICCFLALAFICRITILPPRRLFRNIWGRFFAMLGCALFSWWLIYQAENTRMGWYRFHILQRRVQQMISKAPAYVITTDEDDIITGTSNNIRSLTGYDKKELVGQPARIIMRAGVDVIHEKAIVDAVKVLRDNDHSPDAGWGLQGREILYIRRKDGTLAPVRIYAGGIRWSEDVRFDGDIDLFAVIVPEDSAVGSKVRPAPTAPSSPSITPLPHRENELDKDNSIPLMARPGSGGEIMPAKPKGDEK